MNVEDMVFISVDDHVVEPPDMFEGRMPARYGVSTPIATPCPSSTRPRAIRSSHCARLTVGKCAHNPSSALRHGPAGRCTVLASLSRRKGAFGMIAQV